MSGANGVLEGFPPQSWRSASGRRFDSPREIASRPESARSSNRPERARWFVLKRDRELRKEQAYRDSGYTARTLVREADLRVVLIVMKKGARMADHTAEETSTLQPLSGSVQVRLPGRDVALTTGHLLALERGVKHDVEALDESVLLLTIEWRGASPLS